MVGNGADVLQWWGCSIIPIKFSTLKYFKRRKSKKGLPCICSQWHDGEQKTKNFHVEKAARRVKEDMFEMSYTRKMYLLCNHGKYHCSLHKMKYNARGQCAVRFCFDLGLIAGIHIGLRFKINLKKEGSSSYVLWCARMRKEQGSQRAVGLV